MREMKINHQDTKGTKEYEDFFVFLGVLGALVVKEIRSNFFWEGL